MLQEAAPVTLPGSFVIDRRTSALPRPFVADVSDKIADLLSEFTEDALRDSFKWETMPIILGALRSREMFPKSNRFQTRKLVSWENRTRAMVTAADGFDVIFDPSFAPIEPYAVMPVQAFGIPLRPAIIEMQKRLRVDPYGFSILWMGSGGHVTPLHHDGDLVHGRWHLVVRGDKQFDFVPPRSRRVPRLAWWDLYRRFSPLYTSPLPDFWLTDGTGAYRLHLGPGQMVTWGRKWWHRVEIAKSGVTIALSTRGYQQKDVKQLRGIAYHLGSVIIGDAERFLEALGDEPPIMTLDQLKALCR
jgi:Cupin-like domain